MPSQTRACIVRNLNKKLANCWHQQSCQKHGGKAQVICCLTLMSLNLDLEQTAWTRAGVQVHHETLELFNEIMLRNTLCEGTASSSRVRVTPHPCMKSFENSGWPWTDKQLGPKASISTWVMLEDASSWAPSGISNTYQQAVCISRLA